MAEYENPYQDKINQDKKNLIKLRAGTANQQLMDAAYLGARQEPAAVMTWMNAAESGLTSFTEAIDKSRKAREAEIDKMNGNIDAKIEALTTNGYSLGKNYYEQANIYTEELREQYLAAEGNTKEQNRLKMELNVASKNIAGVKTAIEDIATAWESDDIEKLALKPIEQKMMDIAMDPDGKGAVWIEGENTFGWEDPDTKEVYTVKQLQDIQKLASKDYIGKEEFMTYEKEQEKNGHEFKVHGTGNTFSEQTEMYNNEKRITKENIRFYINGDFTGDGTKSFKDAIVDHPDWDDKIFDHLTENALEKYDNAAPIGEITIDDFVGKNRAAQMELVYNAITSEGPGYDFDVTKGLIAEYMTLRAKERFYGGKEEFNKMKEMDPRKSDSWEEYTKSGGNRGYAENVLGWTRIPAELYPTGHRKQGEIKKKATWSIDPNVGFTGEYKYD